MIPHTHDGRPCRRCDPASDRVVKYGATVLVPSEWFTPEKETPVPSLKTANKFRNFTDVRAVKSVFGKTIQTGADKDGDIVLQVEDDDDSLLGKATARELALNLLIATGDAPSASVLEIDAEGDVRVSDGRDVEYLYAGTDFDAVQYTARRVGMFLTALVHGPALLETTKTEAVAKERLTEIGRLAEIAASGATHISPAHMTAAERLYDAGVRAPEAA